MFIKEIYYFLYDHPFIPTLYPIPSVVYFTRNRLIVTPTDLELK